MIRSWTCRSPCHVVYTDFRPTPLQHYIFPSGCDGLYLVVDENGKFKNDSFQKAIAALSDAENNASAAKQKAKGKKGSKQSGEAEESDIFKIVKMIMERQYDPVSLYPPAPFPALHCSNNNMQPPSLKFFVLNGISL